MARSKLAKVDQDQTLINGLKANFASKTAFFLANTTWTVGDLVVKLTARSAARTTTASAKVSYSKAVEEEEANEAEVAPLRRGLQRTLQARYGDNSTKLGEFGFSPSKRTAPSAETKADAVKQAMATREARGTKGKNAKKAIKGVVPADGGVTASGGATQAGASASTAAPAKAASATN